MNTNLPIPSPALQSPGKKQVQKPPFAGGKNRFSSFITACCQAGFQLNFSCTQTQALLFPELSHHLNCPPLPLAPGCVLHFDTPPSPKSLSSLSLPLLQGPQSHTVVRQSFKLPNLSHLCEKLVLTSLLYSNRVYFASQSSFYAVIFKRNWQQRAPRHFQPQLCAAPNANWLQPARMWGERGAASPPYSFSRGDEGLLLLVFLPLSSYRWSLTRSQYAPQCFKTAKLLENPNKRNVTR